MAAVSTAADDGRIKIALVGPSKAGKTVVANFLAGERTELEVKAAGELGPTVGVRILKFDRAISGLGTMKVELWDTSGNETFEAGWPAVRHNMDGVILMYNPADGAQTNEINLWHQWFVKDPDFDTRRVVVFAYRHTAAQAAKMVTPPKALVSYPMYETSPDTPAALKDGLDNLLEAVNRQAGR